MKQKFVLIAAIAFGLIAALLTRSWIDSKENEYAKRHAELTRKTEKVQVIVAYRTLPKGTVVATADIANGTVFEAAVRGRPVITKDDYMRILGRRLEQTIEAGSPIFWSDIEGGTAGYKGLAHDVQPGMRAVSIAVSGANAVSGMIRPNDAVDVLGTFVFGDESGAKADELVTLTMLQNVTVLATGTDTAKTIDPMERNASGYSTVTLEVTPREAELLVFAQQMRGRLSLTLRSPNDVQYETELPRVDFKKVEAELSELNEYRQKKIRGAKSGRGAN
jgi:pilus assembly protein CpaB